MWSMTSLSSATRAWVGVILGLLTQVTGSVGAAEEAFALEVSGLAEGPVPKEALFVVEGVFEIEQKDGVKTVKISPEPITDANAQVGDSAKGNASIEARVFASRLARSYPRFGVSVHGMSGYRLIVNPPLKQVELVKGDEVKAKAAFVWESDSWVQMKLTATRAGEAGPWTISGSVWAAGSEEPAQPLLTLVDESGMKGTGKCGLWGTPYSEKPIYFDAVRGRVEKDD
jgi:hypothetical protein